MPDPKKPKHSAQRKADTESATIAGLPTSITTEAKDPAQFDENLIVGAKRPIGPHVPTKRKRRKRWHRRRIFFEMRKAGILYSDTDKVSGAAVPVCTHPERARPTLLPPDARRRHLKTVNLASFERGRQWSKGQG